MPYLSARRVVKISFIVDLFDAGLSLLVVILTGSVVMLAEFFQALADLVAVTFLLVGLKSADKKPDKQYPFGYGKEIYFWTLISAIIMISITATASFYFGLKRLLNPEEINHIYLAYLVLVLALLANGYSFSLSLRRILGKKSIKNFFRVFMDSGLTATKNTFALDLMGAAAAFLGLLSLILYQFTGALWFDGLGAMAVGMVMAIFAALLIFGVKGFLIGKRASPETEKQIKTVVMELKEVKEILELKTMQIGPEKLLVNLDIHIKDGMSTTEIEVLIDTIEEKISKVTPSAHHIQVELETPG